MTEQEKARLEAEAREIRKGTLEAIGFLGVGHVGGALSIADLLAVLYGKQLRFDPSNPRMEGRDRLVLSKGHAGPALYATLAIKGFFPADWLHTLNKGGTNLPSHCDRNKTPGIDMTTGSLGQGISAACGIALANRLDGRKVFTFAVIGDGESDEGQVWEAAMFAAHNRLDHLVAFTDNNRMQIDGTTAEVLSIDASGVDRVPGAGPSDLVAKWSAFGWDSERVDGHDVAALDAAITRAKERATAGSGRPTMLVLDTVKGKGAAFCEGQVGSHNMNVDYETAKKAIAALDAQGGRQ